MSKIGTEEKNLEVYNSCVKCGTELNQESSVSKCDECIDKAYTVEIMKKMFKQEISPETAFEKQEFPDILGINKFLAVKYLKMLKKYELVHFFTGSDMYILKDELDINNFILDYEDITYGPPKIEKDFEEIISTIPSDEGLPNTKNEEINSVKYEDYLNYDGIYYNSHSYTWWVKIEFQGFIKRIGPFPSKDEAYEGKKHFLSAIK
ncbi:MAG: hypothetical protein ACRCVG_00695 [Methanobacteriaceae archaeon]